MPTEIVLRKRASTRVGEMGLFCDVEVWEGEFSAIKMDSDVRVTVSQPRSLKQHQFAWVLATKVAEACDFLETKEDAMEYMLIEARHCRIIHDKLRGITYARPKPTNWGAMDGVAFTKLLRRMTHVVATHIVPGIDKDELRREIEKMLHPDLIPTEDTRPEPPPIDTIPDGPGMGHNSRPAGVAPVEPAPAAPARQTTYAEASGAAERKAAPEPPQAQQTASQESGGNATVWYVDMAGEPDWTKDMPGDPGMYRSYGRFQIDRKAEHGLAMGWLEGDQQVALRREIGAGIEVRNYLRRYADEKFGVKR